MSEVGESSQLQVESTSLEARTRGRNMWGAECRGLSFKGYVKEKEEYRKKKNAGVYLSRARRGRTFPIDRRNQRCE